MSEIDTRLCCNCGVTLNGYSGLRHCGTYTTHSHADCIRNLLARAEKAEALVNDMHLDHRTPDPDAVYNTAWNDAIEAAKGCVDGNHPFSILAEMDLLKKGGTP